MLPCWPSGAGQQDHSRFCQVRPGADSRKARRSPPKQNFFFWDSRARFWDHALTTSQVRGLPTHEDDSPESSGPCQARLSVSEIPLLAETLYRRIEDRIGLAKEVGRSGLHHDIGRHSEAIKRLAGRAKLGGLAKGNRYLGIG